MRGSNRGQIAAALLLTALTALGACTSLVGLDKEYGLAEADDGSAGTGGVSFEGGIACRSNDECPGQKCCPAPSESGLDPSLEVCVYPVPLVGCSRSDCTPCPAPPQNAMAICDGEQCSFRCLVGYRQEGSACVPDTSNDGGLACDPNACPPCKLAPMGCCRSDGTCGCTWWSALFCL